MAVIYYGDGDHPVGFVGHRVATTIGTASEFRQKYFPVSQYGYLTGSRLAQELDAKWRADALEHRRAARLTSKGSSSRPGSIVTGLTAMFSVHRGAKAHHSTIIRPVFRVPFPGYGAGHRQFSVARLGLTAAFEQAVDFYSQIHCLTNEEKISLLNLVPSVHLFSHTLRIALLKRGLVITQEEVEHMIDGGAGNDDNG